MTQATPSWINALVEHAYQGAIKGQSGCWIYSVDGCSYECVGQLTFRRGDGAELTLSESQLRANMRPT